MTNTLSSARMQAAAILKAWSSDNLPILQQNLVLAAEGQSTSVADTGEGERLEMLAAIAANMKLLLDSDQLYCAAKYLPLLQHLASPPPHVFEYAYCC